jgi:uncharacterized protein
MMLLSYFTKDLESNLIIRVIQDSLDFMEIRDPIHGNIMVSPAEEAILDSKVFQRLRQIKQLGFAEFSFPGATHNRFLHSIGASHLAGLAFDSAFRNFKFSSEKNRLRLRQALKLGALLHDVGHGPLSHTTEEVMPTLGEVSVPVYTERRSDIDWPKELNDPKRLANHEDYTIKFITDSSLTEVLRKNLSDISPMHIACLIDKTLKCPDDFFKDGKLDFRPILSQLVSSELDVDRMDYLERDAYFCGTNYGRVEQNWILNNITYHIKDDALFMAINRRALYAFDDFLLSRHHMNLMVYFHHKSIIYEEMLMRYLNSKECSFRLPAKIDDYISCTDYALYEHLKSSSSDWAKRISERRPFKMVFEFHATEASERVHKMQVALQDRAIPVIFASSSVRLSKYHGGSTVEKNFPIFVVDQFDKKSAPYNIEESTSIFQKYDEIRRIDRLYVPPELFSEAEKITNNY